jgi:hypothetical protein
MSMRVWSRANVQGNEVFDWLRAAVP